MTAQLLVVNGVLIMVYLAIGVGLPALLHSWYLIGRRSANANDRG